jgi:hypothetical protein
MCLACQMEDELWFAYLDHVAQQEKKAAGQTAEAEAPATSETPTPDTKAAPASPFVCDEQPSE